MNSGNPLFGSGFNSCWSSGSMSNESSPSPLLPSFCGSLGVRSRSSSAAFFSSSSSSSSSAASSASSSSALLSSSSCSSLSSSGSYSRGNCSISNHRRRNRSQAASRLSCCVNFPSLFSENDDDNESDMSDTRPVTQVRHNRSNSVFYMPSNPEIQSPVPMCVDCSTPVSVVRPEPTVPECRNDDDMCLCCENTQEDDADPSAEASPFMKNLPTPVPDRCESVSSSYCFSIKCETDVSESPFKFPRRNECIGGSSRKQNHTSETPLFQPYRRGQLNRSGLGGYLSKSACELGTIPTPDFNSKKEDEYHEENVRGVRLMVKTGKDRHKRISPATAADIITKKIPLPEKYSLVLWDARFPYEFKGHICYKRDNVTVVEAQNFTYPNIRGKMDKFVMEARKNDSFCFILCYCQFSSARAPTLVDILHAAERDIMLESVSAKGTLQFEEESRFVPLIIDGGYDGFFAKMSHLCEGGYIEEVKCAEGKKCRSAYELDIADACASRVLTTSTSNHPQPSRLTKKTRSFCNLPGFSMRPFMNSENDYGNTDPETQDECSSLKSLNISDDEPDPSFNRTSSENVL